MGGVKPKKYAWYFWLILLLARPAVLPAQDIEEIEFDLFLQNKQVTVWLNLAPLLNENYIQSLHEGIDLAVEYDLTLKSPRRFWGSSTVTDSKRAFKMSYRVVTDEYILQFLDNKDSTSEHKFIALNRLRQFLNDSVMVQIANEDSLKLDRSYFIELKITIISLTLFNEASKDKESSGGGSPIKSLFNSFLDLTNYGREEIKVKSHDFSLGELVEVPDSGEDNTGSR